MRARVLKSPWRALALALALLHCAGGVHGIGRLGLPLGDPLSSAATLILRAILKECKSVDVSVAGISKIPTGTVDGVKLRGVDWRSPKALTCREITADVGRTSIDPRSLLSQARIVFRQPVEGRATVTFNEADFGNFLVHPMIRAAPLGARGRVDFAQSGVRIDPRARSIAFRGELVGPDDGARQALAATLVHGDSGPRVVATLDGAACEDEELGAGLSDFFRTLTVDLDGAEMRYQRMDMANIPPASRMKGVGVKISLDLCVRRFPSTLKF